MKTIILFLSLCCAAFAQNQYYVSTSGSDSNNGTSSGTAWRTIQKAIESFTLGSGGAVINVQPGTYNAVDTAHCPGFGTHGTNACVDQGGSSLTVRLVIQCANGSTPIASAIAAKGRCVITGGGDAGFVIRTTSSTHGRVDFIDINGFDIGNAPQMFSGLFVVNNDTHGSSIHFISNYIHDLGSTASGPQGAGCPQTGAIENHQLQGQTDGKIIGNYIFNFGRHPFPSCFNAHGMYLGPGIVIENNIVDGAPDADIQIYHGACKDVISNNVLLNAQVGIIFNDSGTCGSSVGSTTFANNYFGAHTGGHLFYAGTAECSAGTRNLLSHNFSDGVGNDFASGGPFSCDVLSVAFTHAAGTAVFNSYVPGSAGANYTPRSGSALIAGGSNACSTGTGAITPCVPSTDILGIAQTNPPSVGAYTATGGTVTKPAPPTGLTAIVH